jgi:hypothetical protein
MFHGGPLQTEFFGGHTFWSQNVSVAVGYMDGADDLFVIEVEFANETVARDSDYLPESDDTNEGDWAAQTAAILAAVADGATCVESSDGIVIINAARFQPRRVTVEEAETLAEQAFAA